MALRPELFERIACSIAIGNSDDHARNHAAFWDGRQLNFTPAFDLSPCPRSGETATQAMAFDVDGRVRQSNFAALVAHSRAYGLSESQARERVGRVVVAIRSNWVAACDIGELSAANRDYLWGCTFSTLQRSPGPELARIDVIDPGDGVPAY